MTGDLRPRARVGVQIQGGGAPCACHRPHGGHSFGPALTCTREGKKNGVKALCRKPWSDYQEDGKECVNPKALKVRSVPEDLLSP